MQIVLFQNYVKNSVVVDASVWLSAAFSYLFVVLSYTNVPNCSVHCFVDPSQLLIFNFCFLFFFFFIALSFNIKSLTGFIWRFFMPKLANEQEIISRFCSCCSEYSKLCFRNNYFCILYDLEWISAPFHTCVPVYVVFIIPNIISNLVF
jgi:hypothetical protein